MVCCFLRCLFFFTKFLPPLLTRDYETPWKNTHGLISPQKAWHFLCFFLFFGKSVLHLLEFQQVKVFKIVFVFPNKSHQIIFDKSLFSPTRRQLFFFILCVCRCRCCLCSKSLFSKIFPHYSSLVFLLCFCESFRVLRISFFFSWSSFFLIFETRKWW